MSISKQIIIGNIKNDTGSKGTIEKYHAESIIIESSNSLTYKDPSQTADGDGAEVILDGDFIAHTFRARSDARLKENISNIEDSLSIVNKLNAKKYNFKSKTKESYGFIAQDMETILPDLVEDDVNGIKTISYGEIIPILSEAIKDLNSKVIELDKKLLNV